jgi:rhodanese-related sulfurtransferase
MKKLNNRIYKDRDVSLASGAGMAVLKQVVAILIVSFLCGLTFNVVSPNGIDILNNPWSKRATRNLTHHTEYDTQVVEDEAIVFIGFDRACQFIDNREGIILDARIPEAYRQGHISGAHLLSFYEMSKYYPKLKEQLEVSPSILIYCGDISCEDSEFLANELLYMGHAPIFVYKGGFEEWKKKQMPVERGTEEGEVQ